MAKYRDHYIIQFSTDKFKTKWVCGNIKDFFRGLWEGTPQLRSAWGKELTKAQFSQSRAGVLCAKLRAAKGTNTVVLELVPVGHKYRGVLYCTVTRVASREQVKVVK